MMQPSEIMAWLMWAPLILEAGSQRRRILWLLHKTGDAPLIIDFHDAERLGFLAADRDGGDGDISIGLRVLGDNAAEIHPVKLVAAQNDHIFEVVVQEMNQIFAHG